MKSDKLPRKEILSWVYKTRDARQKTSQERRSGRLKRLGLPVDYRANKNKWSGK